MTRMLVLSLDADVAGHLAVAIHRHISAAEQNGIGVPPQLAELQAAAQESARPSVTESQQASQGFVVLDRPEHGLHDRDFLSRQDVRRLTGASLSTVDRWCASGRLRSRRQGRVRRISRADLDAFLGAA